MAPICEPIVLIGCPPPMACTPRGCPPIPPEEFIPPIMPPGICAGRATPTEPGGNELACW